MLASTRTGATFPGRRQLCLLALAAACALQTQTQGLDLGAPSVFPLPHTYTFGGNGSGCLRLAPGFTIAHAFEHGAPSDPSGGVGSGGVGMEANASTVLVDAIARALAVMLPCAPASAPTIADPRRRPAHRGGAGHPGAGGRAGQCSVVRRLVVTVASPPGATRLAHGVDESYSLDVAPAAFAAGAGTPAATATATATAAAATVWGALHALQTFSQLFRDGECTCNTGSVRVADAPRFGWRGFMIDTGRQWIPPALLYATLDAMSYGKMNVLHWHLTDDESFSFGSTSVPSMAAGASTAPGRVYTHAVIADVTAYATARGIRVVPEVESPGHGTAWEAVFPGTLTECPGATSDFYTRHVHT